LPERARLGHEVGQHHHRSPTLTAVAVVAALGVTALVAWVVAGLIFSVLHVLEIILVGIAAAWAGYRVGHWRGSRHPRI
jgi:membrane protein required for beta-lactamase induction